MQAYVLTTESTCDLPAERLEALGIPVIPMEFTIDGGEAQCDRMCFDGAFEVFHRMREGAAVTTALVSQLRYEDFWRPLLEAGNDILHIAFSSALSGSCNCAMLAAEALMEEFPGRTVHVVDSRGASGGQGLLVEHAAMQKQSGLDFDACRAWTEENKFTVHHSFTVDDLKYLYRGGRMTATAAFMGTMLRIKPVCDMDLEGRLIPRAKVNGRLASIKLMAETFRKRFDPAMNPFVLLCHADCQEDADKLAELLLAAQPELEIRRSFIGSIIGAHSGPGTLALFYRGPGRA